MTTNHQILAASRAIATLLLALLLAACGQGGGEITAADTGGDPLPIPDFAVFADTVGEYCGDTGESRIEMAFNGTVRGIISGPPTPVDEQTETNPNPAPQPWVTFDVHAWYTDDLGTEIALWAPGFEGDPGERWLIAASRYTVGGAPSGDVYWCESMPESPEAMVAWADRYGGTVDPGANTPEGIAPPELLAQIDAAEAQWLVAVPANYTALISSEGTITQEREGCPNWRVRVVVSDGQLIEATNPDADCAVPFGEAPTVEGLFTHARAVAGASEFGIEFDTDYGFVVSLGAKDRSVEFYGGVSQFVAEARPYGPAEDRETMRTALTEARARWETANVTDYTATVDNLCFCGFGGPLDITVINGEVIDTSGGDERSPNLLDEFDLTIDQIFDRVAQAIERADLVHVVYHPEVGYPVDVDIDYARNTIDDELQILVEDLRRSD